MGATAAAKKIRSGQSLLLYTLSCQNFPLSCLSQLLAEHL